MSKRGMDMQRIEVMLGEFELDLVARLGHSKSHSKKTIQNVRGIFLVVRLNPEEVKRSHLVKWIRGLIHTDVSAKTIRNRVSSMRAFFVWLIEIDVIDLDPTIGLRMPKSKTGPGAGSYTLDEITSLFDSIAAWESGGDSRRAPYGPLRTTFYPFMVHTCMRLNECRTQRWEDIDLDRRWLTTTEDKSRRGDVIPISAEVVGLLTSWRPYSAGELVFPKVPSHHTLAGDLERAGIRLKRGGFHAFRKTGITLRANLGASHRDLAKLARHLNPALTAEIYDRPDVEEIRGVAEMLKFGEGDTSDHPSGLVSTQESRYRDSNSASHTNGAGGIRTPESDHPGPPPRLRLAGF